MLGDVIFPLALTSFCCVLAPPYQLFRLYSVVGSYQTIQMFVGLDWLIWEIKLFLHQNSLLVEALVVPFFFPFPSYILFLFLKE